MNESTSKSSVKSSTGNSSGSTNRRKTRTIIVARAIPDASANSTTHSDVGASAVVDQQHSRDARSGKLASYAALGGTEDVERFDQFLAEQRGQPSASELRAAAASPHHMVASMKRKTMSQIQLDGLDGKPSDGERAGEDAATRKFMQQEMENDARKRREEAVAQRKWLNSLPIHERVAHQRQQNALRKWRQMNREWEMFKARAARRLGKAPQELVMSRAAAYREQREMYDALQKARPLSEKVGGDTWLVSLRDEGTRFVPVGNIFSGLFCPIRESTKLGPRVRRPLDYHGNQENREHEASRPLSKLEKRSLNLLARKKWRLRKQLAVLQPHEVDRSASSHLAVGTTDLYAWALGATENSDSDINNEGPDREHSAIGDEASRRRRLRSYASPSSPKSMTKGGSGNNQLIGPSLRIAYVADDDEDGDNTQASDAVRNNPEACLPPLRLSFYTPVGEQDQRSLSITNDGSTIVHYQWWRAPFEDENAELTTHLRGHRTRREEQELEQFTITSVSKLGGTLLPGETQQFTFTFQSLNAGVFLEKWLLDVDPQPRICFGVVPMDTDTDSSGKDLPVEVRLSCVAEDNFAAWGQRKKLLAHVEQRESQFFVANLVDELLEVVRPPVSVVFNELTPREDVTKFYDQNGSNGFSDVYFSPDLVHDCYSLYQRAQGILRALPPVQAAVVEEEKPSNEDTAGNSGEDAEKLNEVAPVALPEQTNSLEGAGTEAAIQHEITQNAPLLAQEWDWRLDTLRELCKMADETQNIQIGRLTRQLKKYIDDVEEEEENEEDDEDEAEKSEDDETDDDEEESASEETTAMETPRLSPREPRKIERLTRRKALEDEISALKPDFQEAFDMMRFAAHTAPYKSTRLQDRLYETIGSLCSETPVVCEIAKAMHAALFVQAAKVDGVGKLLTRAIDEAIGGDQDHQALFEQERRRIQSMWLGDKSSYLSISQWMANTAASTSLPPVVSTTESIDSSPNTQNLEHLDSSGVVLMQVDLDLAPWFSLVQVEAKKTAAFDDGSLPKLELAWRFSQELVQHATFVPAKVVQAAESLETVLNALPRSIHTIVLLSELGRPPLTRQMYKLLQSAAQAEWKANAVSMDQTTGETEESKTQRGGEQGEETEAAITKSILDRLSSQLSLRSVAQVVQRAIHKDVVFCSAVEEMKDQIDLSRKEPFLNTSSSFDVVENEVSGDEIQVVSDTQRAEVCPRILLLEHIDAAGIDLITRAARKRELAASKPVTPASETHKPPVGGKKTSVAAPAKGKTGTLGASAAPAPTPPPETPPSSTRDLTKLELAGKDLSEQGVKALRNQFVCLADACVLDGIPSQASEGVFVSTSKPDDSRSPFPTFAGPTLVKELEIWSKTLQPMTPDTSRINQPRALTAVVGGKCLESKLRLIDGLLEVVHEIYFVGEVAMSLYRVLHTKQATKSNTLNRVGTKHEKEEEEQLEEGKNFLLVDGGTKPSRDEIEHGDGKEPGDRSPLGSAHSTSLWHLLVPAVEKLQQKASRKCVRLLLPTDWIVGEIPLEEQDFTATVFVEDDEDEEEEEEEEGGDKEEEVGGRGKNSRKRRALEMKSPMQKPLLEPDHADIFELKRQGAYEGERAHVILNHASSDDGWRTFHEVTPQCLSNARVTEGKSSMLTSLWPESEGDDGDDEIDDGAMHNLLSSRFEYDWTFRALDVGPIAMEALSKLLKHGAEKDVQERASDALRHSRDLIINGVCGAVEFREFCGATKQLLWILQDYNPSEVFIAGSSTARWLRQLEIEQLNSVATGQEKGDTRTNSQANSNINVVVPVASARRIVDDRIMRNARVLKQLVAAKPHPILASLVSSDTI